MPVVGIGSRSNATTAALRDAMEPARRSAEIVLTELGANHDVTSAAVVAFERLPMPTTGTSGPLADGSYSPL